MTRRLRQLLGLSRESDYIRDHLDFSNMRTSLYMASVIALLEVWMIYNLFREAESGLRSRGWIIGHLAFYILLFTASVVILVYSIYHLRKGINRHRVSLCLFIGFSLVCVIFGMYISYVDYSKGEQLFTFMAMMVFGLCLVVSAPWLSFIISSITFGTMYVLMSSLDGASYATRVNFFVLWICVFLCAVGNYSVRLQHAIKSEEMENSNVRLLEQSMIDELTGLKNRACMNIETLELKGRETVVVMADVDNFKYINDTYNHAMGDEVLIRVADTLTLHFSDIVSKNEERWFEFYRFGGDGFIIFSSGMPVDEFTDRVKAWQKDMHSQVFEGTDISVSISCGVIKGTPAYDTEIMDMIRYSDHILYEAKNIGRLQMLVDTLDNMRLKEKNGKLGKRMLMNNETDALTGLPNMIYFRHHAGRMMRDAVSAGDNPEFLYYDIQNFREYNEKNGFHEGDKLLVRIAEKLEELFDGSLVARISDDHFIVYTLLSSEENMKRSEDLWNMIDRCRGDVKLVLKTGVYRSDGGVADASLACDRARMACDSIKNRYDISWRLYDDSIESEFKRRHYIINNLDRAIEENHIVVFYQPIVRLTDGRLSNLEALARWNDPEYGLLSPAAFIPVLEEAHLIYKLDMHIVRRVCSDYAEARMKGLTPVPASVNLSRRDFESCDMVEEIKAITAEYGIPRHLFDIEITESALNDSPDKLADAMRRFKEEGFSLWLDDFGSGYSSLNVLKDFPFDVLKIDMTFLSSFDSNARTKPIIDSVVHLADKIDMRALTEGVETDEQKAFLKQIGCERAQGYLFGKPMSKEDITDFINSGKLILAEELLEKAEEGSAWS